MPNRIIKSNIPTSLYKKIHSLLPIACVDIIIVNKKNEFFLVKRKNKPALGKWWFPGGRIYKNETLKEAVKRKVLEETGLKVKIVKCLGAEETFFPDGPFSDSTHTINTIFLTSTDTADMKIKLDSQSDDGRWFSKISKHWHPYVKKFLKNCGYEY
jgi:colanic acid biosynthesis protein WcaH